MGTGQMVIIVISVLMGVWYVVGASINRKRGVATYQWLQAELEQIGDIVSKNLIPLANKMKRLGCTFSKQGQTEIVNYHIKTIKQISRAIIVFKDVNLERAKMMKHKYKKYRVMEMNLRRTHFERLPSDVPETISSNEIHIELMELFKQISSHGTNIARILLKPGEEIQ